MDMYGSATDENEIREQQVYLNVIFSYKHIYI